MLDFIVLGYVPGTNYQVSLDQVVAIMAACLSAIILHAVIKRGWVQHRKQRAEAAADTLLIGVYRHYTLAV